MRLLNGNSSGWIAFIIESEFSVERCPELASRNQTWLQCDYSKLLLWLLCIMAWQTTVVLPCTCRWCRVSWACAMCPRWCVWCPQGPGTSAWYHRTGCRPGRDRRRSAGNIRPPPPPCTRTSTQDTPEASSPPRPPAARRRGQGKEEDGVEREEGLQRGQELWKEGMYGEKGKEWGKEGETRGRKGQREDKKSRKEKVTGKNKGKDRNWEKERQEINVIMCVCVCVSFPCVNQLDWWLQLQFTHCIRTMLPQQHHICN